jgi:hypothetical protein
VPATLATCGRQSTWRPGDSERIHAVCSATDPGHTTCWPVACSIQVAGTAVRIWTPCRLPDSGCLTLHLHTDDAGLRCRSRRHTAAVTVTSTHCSVEPMPGPRPAHRSCRGRRQVVSVCMHSPARWGCCRTAAGRMHILTCQCTHRQPPPHPHRSHSNPPRPVSCPVQH